MYCNYLLNMIYIFYMIMFVYPRPRARTPARSKHSRLKSEFVHAKFLSCARPHARTMQSYEYLFQELVLIISYTCLRHFTICFQVMDKFIFWKTNSPLLYRWYKLWMCEYTRIIIWAIMSYIYLVNLDFASTHVIKTIRKHTLYLL